jgi:hypothetical protein
LKYLARIAPVDLQFSPSVNWRLRSFRMTMLSEPVAGSSTPQRNPRGGAVTAGGFEIDVNGGGQVTAFAETDFFVSATFGSKM